MPIDSADDRRALEKLFVPGTRQWLFDKIQEWSKMADAESSMLWLNAVAGVGKSVAAAQVANMLESHAQLVAAIFLKYNDVRKNNPLNVLRTIAYHLCMWYAPIGRKLLAANHSHLSLDKLPLPEKFKALITDPLQALGDYTPKEAVVILIDGLDECSPRDSLMHLLVTLMERLKVQAPWMKLLLTSRPETDISSAFAKLPTKTIDPSGNNNLNDLKVFIEHSLEQYNTLAVQDIMKGTLSLLATSDGENNIVSSDSSKSFVWIRLILNSIKEEYSNGIIVTLELIEDINNQAKNVDTLYKKTFEKALIQLSGLESEFMIVLVALCTGRFTMTPTSIASFFFYGVPEIEALQKIHSCLLALSIVLDPAANGLTTSSEIDSHSQIKFNHKSVADYLLGKSSVAEKFHVKPWKCAQNHEVHDVWISYRVATEGHVASQLHSALNIQRMEEEFIHTYDYHHCMGTGFDGFINGLFNSRVVVILLSDRVLKRMCTADSVPDNQLLEVSSQHEA
ncbi:hypothetical protein BC830DRAFT_120421 [Chytriomyces sp. MP71]|nr:hypothetical protein BC830DRAFT_120421 [Chytriomyces sp. MP71]